MASQQQSDYSTLQAKCNEGTGAPCCATASITDAKGRDIETVAKDECKSYIDRMNMENCQTNWDLIENITSPINQDEAYKKLTNPSKFQVALVMEQLVDCYLGDDPMKKVFRSLFIDGANVDRVQLYKAGDGEAINGVTLIAQRKDGSYVLIFYFVD